jgi:hypothetical protein
MSYIITYKKHTNDDDDVFNQCSHMLMLYVCTYLVINALVKKCSLI